MTTHYSKILSQNGLAEFKALIEKWETLSEKLLDKPSGVPIILPNRFLFLAREREELIFLDCFRNI